MPNASLFTRTLYRDFHETVLPLILRNYDRMSMAHGVEVRMPFMDWRLVTFVFSLPPTSLLGQGYTKLILRRAMQGRVPAEVLTRRDKIGFASPLSVWFRDFGHLWLENIVRDTASLQSSCWNGRVVRDVMTMLEHDYSWSRISTVWSFIHANSWLQQFTQRTSE